jgi:hypothetical protein
MRQGDVIDCIYPWSFRSDDMYFVPGYKRLRTCSVSSGNLSTPLTARVRDGSSILHVTSAQCAVLRSLQIDQLETG